MTKKKKRGICLLIFGLILSYILLSNAEIIDEIFPEFLAFIIVLLGIMCIVIGILFITSKTEIEYQIEYNKTNEENKKLAKYFNKKTYITYLILALNIIAYILTLFINDDIILKLAISKEGIMHGRIYEFITYMFIHTDEFHVLCNMLFLLYFGSKVESLIGSKKYFLLYLISGIVGGIFACLFSNNPVIGASGSLYGILGSLLIIAIINKDKMAMLLSKTLMPIIIYSVIESLIFVGISLSAHLGGLISGILFIIISGKDKYKLK